MRIWAISDLHLSHPDSRGVLEDFPASPDDWLILAGDVTHGAERLDGCLEQLAGKFRQVVWVPGNHELWTVPKRVSPADRRRAVRAAGPDRPLPRRSHPRGSVPGGRASGRAGSDRAALPALRLQLSTPAREPRRRGAVGPGNRRRLRRRAAAAPGSVSGPGLVVRVALRGRRDPARVVPGGFAEDPGQSLPARGTTRGSAPDSPVHAVVRNPPDPWLAPPLQRVRGGVRAPSHPGTQWLDGVPFHEVSLGYPKQWDRRRGVGAYLRALP